MVILIVSKLFFLFSALHNLWYILCILAITKEKYNKHIWHSSLMHCNRRNSISYFKPYVLDKYTLTSSKSLGMKMACWWLLGHIHCLINVSKEQLCCSPSYISINHKFISLNQLYGIFFLLHITQYTLDCYARHIIIWSNTEHQSDRDSCTGFSTVSTSVSSDCHAISPAVPANIGTLEVNMTRR